MSLSERLMNDRRQWKAETFPYDYYLPDDTEECQYCLTEKQAEILRGMLQPLAWKTRWWSDSDATIDQDTIEAYRDDIIRRLMMSCCDSEFGTIFQWTVDGVLQKSTDGGATWQDAPEDDPRNSSPVYPPVAGDTSDEKRCIAANSVKTLVKEQIGDQLTDDMSRYTLGQLISDWVNTILQTSNPFEAIVTIVTNQILALVIATLRPALTDDVYSDFECCVYENMADDLSFDDAQWAAVRSCITDKIGGIAGIFLEHLVYLIGKVVLTNLARSQAATDGDCSACDCTDGCTVEWTFYGVHSDTIVKISDCHYTMTTQASLGHFAFSSGDSSIGCYFAGSGAPIYSTWGLGSSTPNGVNSKTNPIWNYDAAMDDGTELDLIFSSAPIP